MKSKKPAKKPQVRRTALLDEAIRMFGELGFHGLTVQGLAARCDISGAGLLYYFRSKEELLLAVLDEIELRGYAEVIPLIKAVEQAEGNLVLAWHSLIELLRQMFRHAVSNPDIARFVLLLQVESLEAGHVAHAWFRKREQLALDLIMSLLTPHVSEPESNSRHVMSLMHGLAQQWIRQDMNFDVVTEWDKVLEVVLSRGRISAS